MDADVRPSNVAAAESVVGATRLRSLLRDAVTAVGGEDRPGQVRMAEAVAAAMASSEHLVVQAGTGTGKSLAYLVPSLDVAIRENRRVVVATATLALQGQLVDKDLPQLTHALDSRFERPPRFAMLKGRSNYACLHRLRNGVPNDQGVLVDVPPTTQLGRDVRRLQRWAQETDTGDRDHAPAASDRAWAQISVSARECLGAMRCPYGEECFAERARDVARNADVVVTNHALLAIDMLDEAAILPEHDIVVVDEAHELAARVTSVASDELAPGAVDRAAVRARAHVGADGADALAAAGELLAEALGQAREGEVRELHGLLRESVLAVRDGAQQVVTAFSGDRIRGDSDAEASRRQARGLGEEVLAVAGRLAELSSYDVAWIADRERAGRALRVAPLSVAGLLRDRLFGTRTVILTSATLRIGGDFDAIARAVGLSPAAAEKRSPTEPPSGDDESSAGSSDDPEELHWRGLDVGSPFDPPRQGILYVARRLPAPGRETMSAAVLDELAELVEAAGGRTLGLFSSRRAMVQAAEAMRERLTVPVLCQGDDTLVELVRAFAADGPTCLFGTLSLWQGVDVPGTACQLVVIDRIPFPRPDDPLMAARARAVDEAGGNGFMAVSAAHAALLLAQGAGRLLRTIGDRGVVAVLDPRLATARYGRFLRASLPPYWYSTDSAVVRRSLAAINAAADPVLPVRERVTAPLI